MEQLDEAHCLRILPMGSPNDLRSAADDVLPAATDLSAQCGSPAMLDGTKVEVSDVQPRKRGRPKGSVDKQKRRAAGDKPKPSVTRGRPLGVTDAHKRQPRKAIEDRAVSMRPAPLAASLELILIRAAARAPLLPHIRTAIPRKLGYCSTGSHSAETESGTSETDLEAADTLYRQIATSADG
jgi:hypothetical protein